MNFKLCIIAFVIFHICLAVQAVDLEIIEVKRNITLADTEPIFRDYYIKNSASSKLKKNLVVKAIRKVSVKNAAQKTAGELLNPVGYLKIIHVNDQLAVAREFESISRETEPVLEQVGIMIGDVIDLEGSYIDNKK